MGWTFNSTRQSLPVVKQNGHCRRAAMQKFCPYWVAKHAKDMEHKKPVIGFRCILFDSDKEGYASLPECNAEYGMNYDGPPHP